MKSAEFWDYFNGSVKPHLGRRSESFTKIFDYLDRFDRPVGIIETGCVREKGNWDGDGGSTLLFDKYASCHDGSVVHSVDIDKKATDLCRSLVSDKVTVHTGDSVAYLKTLADNPPAGLKSVDLLYLDSFDVDYENVFPSAFHHVKELIAISPLIHAGTLVVVDDSPPLLSGYFIDNAFHVIQKAKVDGKGKFVAAYAEHIGAVPYFTSYQCGWTKFRN